MLEKIGTIDEILKCIIDLMSKGIFSQDRFYKIEIHEAKNKRSIQQNRYMWKLIREISKKQECDEMEIYINALEDANAKYDYVLGTPSIEEELKKNFRAVKIVRPQEYRGKTMYVYKCFIGSSKFNTDEMHKLIEIISSYADSLGIPTENI